MVQSKQILLIFVAFVASAVSAAPVSSDVYLRNATPEIVARSTPSGSGSVSKQPQTSAADAARRELAAQTLKRAREELRQLQEAMAITRNPNAYYRSNDSSKQKRSSMVYDNEDLD